MNTKPGALLLLLEILLRPPGGARGGQRSPRNQRNNQKASLASLPSGRAEGHPLFFPNPILVVPVLTSTIRWIPIPILPLDSLTPSATDVPRSGDHHGYWRVSCRRRPLKSPHPPLHFILYYTHSSLAGTRLEVDKTLPCLPCRHTHTHGHTTTCLYTHAHSHRTASRRRPRSVQPSAHPPPADLKQPARPSSLAQVWMRLLLNRLAPNSSRRRALRLAACTAYLQRTWIDGHDGPVSLFRGVRPSLS